MKTLKLIFGMLLITASLFANAATLLEQNEYAYAFIPADAEIDQRGGKGGFSLCDENENMVVAHDPSKKSSIATARDARYSYQCTRYYSRSTDTSWLVTFVQNLGTPMRVRKISKIEKNGQKEIVAEFNPKTTAIKYANPEARRYSSTKGGDNNEVARNSEPTRSAEGAKQQIDALDIARKAAGFLNKF